MYDTHEEPEGSSYLYHLLCAFLRVTDRIWATAECTIFTPWHVPYRRTVLLVVLIVCIIVLIETPAILHGLNQLLR